MTDLPEPSPKRPRRVLFAGVVLFGGWIAALWALPTAPTEFNYFSRVRGLLGAMFGFTVEQAAAYLVTLVLGTLALRWIVAGLYGGSDANTKLRRWSARVGLDTGKRRARLAGGVCLVVLSWLMFGVFRGRALVDDELAYYLQADLLRHGKLATQCLPGAARASCMIASRLGCTGKYLPGEPLVQIPGLMLGMAPLMHLVVALLTLWCTYRALSLLENEEVAGWACLFLGLSPMFLFTAATGMSQTTSLGCLALAAYGYAHAREGSPARAALLVGVGVGFGVLVRPQSMVPMGAVVVLATMWALRRKHRWGALAALTGVLCLFAAALFGYDMLLTGSPLKLPWYLSRITEHYGFGKVFDQFAYRHTVPRAMVNLLVSLIRFNAWWLGWPLSLAVLWYWNRMGRPMRHGKVWLWSSLALIAVLFCYFSPGMSDVGPVYYFELLLPACAVGGSAAVAALERRPRLTRLFLVVQFVLGTGVFVAYQSARISRLLDAIHGPVDHKLAQVDTPALVLYEDSCAEKLVHGWVLTGVGRRWWGSGHPVVTYPRPGGKAVETYLQRYPNRHCYYLRVDPSTRQWQMLSCEQAMPLLERPADLSKLHEPCLSQPSTAGVLGLP